MSYHALLTQLFSVVNPGHLGQWGEGSQKLVHLINDLMVEDQMPPAFDARDSRSDDVEWSTEPHPITGRKYRTSLYRPAESMLNSRAVTHTGLHGCHPILHLLAKEAFDMPQWAQAVITTINDAIYDIVATLPNNAPYVVTAAAGRDVHLSDLEASVPEIPIFVLTLGALVDPRPNVHTIDLSSFQNLVPRSLALFRLAPHMDGRLAHLSLIVANATTTLGIYIPHLLQASHSHGVLTSYNAWGFNPVCLHLACFPAGSHTKRFTEAFASVVGAAHWVYGIDELICQEVRSCTYIVESKDLLTLEFFYANTQYASLGVIAGCHEIGWEAHTYPMAHSFVSSGALELNLALPRPITRQIDNSSWDQAAPWRGKGTVTSDPALLEPVPPPAPVIPVLTGAGWVVPNGKVWRWNETNRGFRDLKHKDHIYLCTPDPISDFTISQPRPKITSGQVFDLVNHLVATLDTIFKPNTRYFVTAADGAYLQKITEVQRRCADFHADEVILFAGHGTLGPIDPALPKVHIVDVPYINESGRSMMYYRLLPYIAAPKPGCQFVIGNVRAGDAPPLMLREKFWLAKRSVLSWNQYHRGPVMNAAHYGIVGDLPIRDDLLHLLTEFAHTYGPDELYFYKHDPVVVRQSSIWDSVAAKPSVFNDWPHTAFVLENGQVTKLFPGRATFKHQTVDSIPFDRVPLLFHTFNFAGSIARFIALLHVNHSFASNADTFALTVGTTGDAIPYKYMAKQVRRFTPRVMLALHLNDHEQGQQLLATLEGTGSLLTSIPHFAAAFEISFLLAEHYRTVVPRQLYAQLPGQTLVDLEPSRLLTRGGEVPGNLLLTIALKIARWLTFGYRISVTAGFWRMPRSADGEHRLSPCTRRPGKLVVAGSTTTPVHVPAGFRRIGKYQHQDLAVDEVHATGNGTIETARYLGAFTTSIRNFADTTYLTPTLINYWPAINVAPVAAAAPFMTPLEMAFHLCSWHPRRALIGLYTFISLYSLSLFNWLIILLTFYFKGRQIFYGLTMATFFFGTTNMLTIILGPVCFAICLALASHIGLLPVGVAAGRLVLQHFELSSAVTFVTILRYPITLPSIMEALFDVIVFTNQSRLIVMTLLPILRGFGSTKYLVVRPFVFSSWYLPHVALYDTRTQQELSLEPTHFRAKIPDRVFYRTTTVEMSEYSGGCFLIPVPGMYYATRIPGFKYLPLGNCFMVLASYGHLGLIAPMLIIFWKVFGLRLSLAVFWYALGQSVVTLCLRLHQL